MKKLTITKFLENYPENLRTIFLELRSLILKELVNSEEIIFPGWKNVSYGTGKSHADKDLICYIAIYKKHINLGFYKGSLLEDEENCLEGNGKLLRHIKIRSKEDIYNPNIKLFLKKAQQESLKK